jgi:hypothetical protein
MYHHRPPVVLGTKISAATGAGTLAFTGLNTAHYLVAAATMIMLGIVLLHLVPRREE